MASPALFSLEVVEKGTPSRRDGMSLEQERREREKLCSYIESMRVHLRLRSRIVIATAQYLMHHFFMRKSFKDYNAVSTTGLPATQMVGAACVFLATKVEENLIHTDSVVEAAFKAAGRPPPKDSEHARKRLFGYERKLLNALGFEVNMEHPYKHLVSLAQELNCSREVGSTAWSILNDSFQTELCVQYRPEVTATVALRVASENRGMPLPEHWLQETGVDSAQHLEAYEQVKAFIARKKQSASESAARKRARVANNGGSDPSAKAARR